MKTIREETEQIKPMLSAWRRRLHRHPEQGWFEIYTTAFLAGCLRSMGYEVLLGEAVCRSESRMGLPSEADLEAHYRQVLSRVFDAPSPDQLNRVPDDFDDIAAADLAAACGGHTGVIATLRCGEGPCVALRFDMDALPITEPSDDAHLPFHEGFASENPGTMHACGHDGHMAIGLGTALLLSRHRNKLHGTVKLIFQPAEEGVRGAASIVDNGHLGNVDYLLAAHIKASDDTCYVAPGMEGTLATTKLHAVFSGTASHAAMAPQEGSNALLAAAAAVLNLQAIPRHGEGSSRINVGSLHAGGSANVICDQAQMDLEVRGETTAVNAYMEDYAVRILKHAAAMHGCGITIRKTGAALCVRCSDSLTGQIRTLCLQELNLPVRPSPGLGASEDFSLMSEQVLKHGGQTCLIGLHVPLKAPLHNPLFDFDEEALALGTAVFSGTVLSLLS